MSVVVLFLGGGGGVAFLDLTSRGGIQGWVFFIIGSVSFVSGRNNNTLSFYVFVFFSRVLYDRLLSCIVSKATPALEFNSNNPMQSVRPMFYYIVAMQT